MNEQWLVAEMGDLGPRSLFGLYDSLEEAKAAAQYYADQDANWEPEYVVFKFPGYGQWRAETGTYYGRTGR